MSGFAVVTRQCRIVLNYRCDDEKNLPTWDDILASLDSWRRQNSKSLVILLQTTGINLEQAQYCLLILNRLMSCCRCGLNYSTGTSVIVIYFAITKLPIYIICIFRVLGVFSLILLGVFLAYSSLGAGSNERRQTPLGAHQRRFRSQ
jgi:hypothetical protein